jgi:hypothetical protein
MDGSALVGASGSVSLDGIATTASRPSISFGCRAHLKSLFIGGPAVTTMQTVFPGGAGRWGVRRTRIREHGLPLELLVISDLTQALSEQELQAWQRLVRVLGHELNNSLTPIKSIAGSLESIAARDPLPEDWRDDMRRGLSVIMSRSDSPTMGTPRRSRGRCRYALGALAI